MIIVRINLFSEDRVFQARLPNASKVVRRARDFVLEARFCYAFKGASHRSKKVGGRLSIRTFEAKINEVIFGIGALAKVYLSTFVENQYLVENLIPLDDQMQEGRQVLTL